MKFLLAGISHETNTFHSIPTEYENFEKSGMLLRGKEIEKLYDTPSTIGGYFSASQKFGFELIHLLFVHALCFIEWIKYKLFAISTIV